MTDTPNEPVQPEQNAAPAVDVAEVKGSRSSKINSKLIGRFHDNGGYKAAAGESWQQVKGAFSEGGKPGVAFGRVLGVGAGVYIASGALQSKNADGTDRGFLHRMGNLAAGVGVAGVSVVAHR